MTITAEMLAAITKGLNEYGYAVTADQVQAQLNLPEDERSMPGRFAVKMLETAGLAPDGSQL